VIVGPEVDSVYYLALGVDGNVGEIELSAGPGWEAVGNGFDTAAGATQFFFGANQATRISCISSTQCTAATPAGPARTTVNVKVIMDGVAGSNQLSFRYSKR
jgi:hypothetical protein